MNCATGDVEAALLRFRFAPISLCSDFALLRFRFTRIAENPKSAFTGTKECEFLTTYYIKYNRNITNEIFRVSFSRYEIFSTFILGANKMSLN